MQTVQKTGYPALKRLGSQIGYGIAIGLSLVLIYVVQNLERWDFVAFLTDDFGEVVPWITFSLVTGALAYLLYIFYDSQTLRWAGEIVTNVITVVVTWKVFTVFPFDFTAYEFPWDTLTRFILILAMAGASIGAIVNLVKIINSGSNSKKGETDAHGI
jgi:hypothetical protein